MLGWKRVYIGDHTSGRSGKVIEGKGEEKGYLPEREITVRTPKVGVVGVVGICRRWMSECAERCRRSGVSEGAVVPLHHPPFKA